MTLNEIKDLLNAQAHTCTEKLGREITSACGSDLMSDVLAFSKNNALLITGLVNPQVVRTAEMMDIKAIIFVRGKTPNEDILNLATEKGIVILTTENLMFSTCGILYNAGLIGGSA